MLFVFIYFVVFDFFKIIFQVYWGFQQFFGKLIFVGYNNLIWILIKSMYYEIREYDDCDDVIMVENNSKFYVVLEVMYECFEFVKEF